MEDYKELTVQTYNEIAALYAARDKDLFSNTIQVLEDLKTFVSLLPPGGSVLDIGMGGGRDYRYLKAAGLRVVGIDNSEEMVKAAQANIPEGDFRVMDFEELAFPPQKFEGIWANASLHHVPKHKLLAILKACRRLMKPDGYLFLVIKHGDFEGVLENIKFGRPIRRFFAYWRPNELSQLAEEAGLKVLKCKITMKGEWLNLLAQKTSPEA